MRPPRAYIHIYIHKRYKKKSGTLAWGGGGQGGGRNFLLPYNGKANKVAHTRFEPTTCSRVVLVLNDCTMQAVNVGGRGGLTSQSKFLRQGLHFFFTIA